MIAGVADTHAALWYLFDDPRLSASAKLTLDDAARSRQKIVLSVISLAEVVYLVEKSRLPASAYTDLQTALRDPDHVLQEAPVTSEIVDAMREVLRVEHPGYAGPHCRRYGHLFWRSSDQSRRAHPHFRRENGLVKDFERRQSTINFFRRN